MLKNPRKLMLLSSPVTHAMSIKPRSAPARAAAVSLTLAALASSAGGNAALLHHELQVSIQATHLHVSDRLRAETGQALALRLPDDADHVRVDGKAIAPPALTIDAAGSAVHVEYRLPRRDAGAVQRLGTADWLADAAGLRHTLQVDIDLPAGWHAVTQGRREQAADSGSRRSERWREPRPLARTHLLAAPYHPYSAADDDGWQAQVYLLEPDAALATRYLQATLEYRRLYQQLLGPFPYDKFALVENDQQTGWGMPSLTLLGSRVIRLPFIVHTSYPHELVHNWWGNSVYPRPGESNWSEGLTTYLSDHWLRERRGQGASYRRDALLRYRNHALQGQDMPLGRFRARHSEASQSVGYDKGMMLFHMLRLRVGDGAFLAGLRRLAARHAHDFAGWAELRAAFEPHDLDAFTSQWLERSGAPRLRLHSAGIGADAGIVVHIRQTGEGPAWQLDVPVEVLFEDGSSRRLLEQVRTADAILRLPDMQGAIALAVDPHFEVMRQLADDEAPATFSALFGARRVRYLLAPDMSPQAHAAWTALAHAWSGPAALVQTAEGTDIPPADGATWLLGPAWRGNATVAAAAAMLPASDGDSAALALTIPDAAAPLGWLQATSPAAIEALGRRLRHHGKQSWVRVDAGKRHADRGQWPTAAASLRLPLAGTAVDWSALQPPPPLAPASP